MKNAGHMRGQYSSSHAEHKKWPPVYYKNIERLRSGFSFENKIGREEYKPFTICHKRSLFVRTISIMRLGLALLAGGLLADGACSGGLD